MGSKESPSGEAQQRLLVVGQRPPPVHGSNIMCALFLDTLGSLGARVRFVEKRLSRSVGEIGKLTPRKIVAAPSVVLRATVTAATSRPALAVLLPAARGTAFAVDAMMMLALRMLRVPFVVYLHGLGYERLAGRGGKWARLLYATLGRSRGAVVLGQRLKADIARWVKEENTFVLPNAVEDVSTRWRRGESSVELREGGVPCLLFLSNLEPTKGAKEFLLAARLVAQRGFRAEYVVGGSFATRAYEAELRAIAASPELEGSVSFPGPLYDEDKARAFRDADLFVFPTYYPVETFGLVNLEAMRAGVPVIATDVGAIPEVVKHEETGLIVPPRDVPALAEAMARLVADEGLRRRFGEAGRRRYEERFSLDAYRRGVRELLHWLEVKIPTRR